MGLTLAQTNPDLPLQCSLDRDALSLEATLLHFHQTSFRFVHVPYTSCPAKTEKVHLIRPTSPASQAPKSLYAQSFIDRVEGTLGWS